MQGRGSAANSAVCYALSITAVDPVKMELLFERFLSEERGEWPDIDLDLPSGDQREKVIQHVYEKYGAHGAGMTANVITYRDRIAAREVGKALGFSPEQVDQLSKQLGELELRRDPGADRGAARRDRRGGPRPATTRRTRHFMRLWLADPEPAPPPGPALRRHGHRGGAARRGRAARAGVDAGARRRPVGQGRLRRPGDRQGRPARPRDARGARGGDPDDPRRTRRSRSTSRTCRRTTPQVYKMLNEADTVGLFQVESRAQMASLPRHAPKTLLRHRRAGRDHPARPDRRRHGPPLLRPAAGAGAGRVSAPVPRADPEAHARRAALPGAAPADRDGRGGLHRRRGGGAAARHGLQALAERMERDRGAGCARG